MKVNFKDAWLSMPYIMIAIIFCIVSYLFVISSYIGKPIYFVCAIIPLSVLLWVSFIIHNRVFDRKKTALLLFGINLLIHIGFVFLVNDKITQISDFANTLCVATNGYTEDFLTYYRTAPHKFLYPFLLHVLGLRTQKSILLFQAVLMSATALMIYLFTDKWFSNHAAILCTILYTLIPGRIMYVAVINEENVSTLLIIILAYLFFALQSHIKNADKNYRRISITALGIGILMGLIVFFKDWGAIFLIAYIIVMMFSLMEFNKKNVGIFVFTLLIIITTRAVILEAVYWGIETHVGASVDRNATPYYMYESLDPLGDGRFNVEKVILYGQLLESNGWNFDYVDSILLNELFYNINHNKERVVPLIISKGQEAYANLSSISQWTFNSLKEEHSNKYFEIYRIIQIVENSLWIAVVICCMISTIFNVRRKSPYLLVIQLFIIGCMLLVVLIESQGRYKYSILPLWYIIAGNLMTRIIEYYYKRRNRN